MPLFYQKTVTYLPSLSVTYLTTLYTLAHTASNSVVRVPLVRGGKPILRNYCAFWKKTAATGPVQDFADILRAQFAAPEL